MDWWIDHTMMTVWRGSSALDRMTERDIAASDRFRFWGNQMTSISAMVSVAQCSFDSSLQEKGAAKFREEITISKDNAYFRISNFWLHSILIYEKQRSGWISYLIYSSFIYRIILFLFCSANNSSEFHSSSRNWTINRLSYSFIIRMARLEVM